MRLRKFLFIRFGGMGDILMATPSIRAVAAKYPDAIIDVVVGGGMTASVTGHPNIRTIYTFDKRGVDSSPLLFAGFLARLFTEGYDAVINLHPSVKSYLMCAAAKPKKVISFRKRYFDKEGRVVHAIDDFAKELAPLGIDALPSHDMDFSVSPAATKRVRAILDEAGVGADDCLLVINPAASRPINRWPVERFQAVVAHYAAIPGVKVAVTGAPSSHRSIMDGLDEVALAAQVCSADARAIDLAGKLTVPELGALLSQASVFLTCDTGPMHIAAALKAPMVVLSGAADPDRTGPLTDNAEVLIDRTLSCVPCRDRTCRRGDVKCMQNIEVDQVILALARRLQKIGSKDYVQPLRIVS